MATNLPSDTMLLTLGCGKFRFNAHDFGTLPGTQLPRLLDMGQCNDSYGALVVRGPPGALPLPCSRCPPALPEQQPRRLSPC